MIGFISGKVIGKLPGQIIIKIPSGLGYMVNVKDNDSYLLYQNVEFYIFEVLKEDRDDLYGFTDIKDREWIDNLIKVNGVGPKAAANIIYTLGWNDLKDAILNEDFKMISSVKGLGLKSAKKIILELKGSIDDFDTESSGSSNSYSDSGVNNFIETFENLGYKKIEITSLINRIKNDGKWNSNDIVDMVKVGLKYMRTN